MGPRPKYSSAYYRAKFEKLATKQRWPGHKDWCFMKQGIISIRMRQALASEDNARWYEDRDRKNQVVLESAGGPAILVVDLKQEAIKHKTETTTMSWADIE